jgi:hypothetical protein
MDNIAPATCAARLVIRETTLKDVLEWRAEARQSKEQNLVIRVFDDAGNVVETYEHTGDFKEC